MAHLTCRNGVFNVRFRVADKYFQKSLKTRDQGDAQAALYGIKQTLHLIKIGKLLIPKGIDAGEFVVSGGTATQASSPKGNIPTFKDVAEAYLASQEGILADSYISSQRTHLSHLETYLNGKSAQRVDKLSADQLEAFIDSCRKSVDGTTVSR